MQEKNNNSDLYKKLDEVSKHFEAKLSEIERIVLPLDKTVAVQTERLKAHEEKIGYLNDNVERWQNPGRQDALPAKTVEWWLAFLGLFMTVVIALGGIGGYIMFSNYEERAKEHVDQTLLCKQEAENYKTRIQEIYENIHALKGQAETDSALIKDKLEGINSVVNLDNTTAKTIEDATKNQTLSDKDRLRALALNAGKNEKWQEAANYWSTFSELYPDDINTAALCNWGAAMGSLGDHEQAYKKFKKAMELDPENAYANCGVGTSIVANRKNKSGKELKRVLDEAEKYLTKAEKLQPGLGAYNLACVSSLKDDGEECLKWLEISRKEGWLPSKDHMAKDPDLDPVRKQEWFIKFMQEASPE